MLEKSPQEIRKLLVNQIKIGQAIRSQRIEYVEDLEEARAEKQEWVSRTTDLLKQLFNDPSVIEHCNDWVGPILPEYAEWALFVELFDKEMKHRISRLTELAMQIEDVQPAPAPTPEPRLIHEPPRPPMTLRIPSDPAARQAIREFLESLINCLESESPTIPRLNPTGSGS